MGINQEETMTTTLILWAQSNNCDSLFTTASTYALLGVQIKAAVGLPYFQGCIVYVLIFHSCIYLLP